MNKVYVKKQVQKGFTLIELMITVAIVGILAAVALPAYGDYTARAQASEAASITDAAKIAVLDVYTSTGAFPTTNALANLPTDTTIVGKYVSKVTVGTGGAVTATFSSASPTVSALQGKTFVYTPVDNGGSYSWTCSGTMPAKYQPKC